ncbi:MAG: STAS domain-containing protein [Spirochaetaceae bacterium]|jgi:anti-anti-sigma factor|nr:STAS domain-containing protein [Spirochaetaceae bacterium]
MTNDEIVPGFDIEKDDSLKVELRRIEGVTGGLILTLSGYIDTYNSTSFQKRVSRAIESGFIKLVFVCSGLNYVSSTGIGSFTAFLKTLKSLSGDMVLQDLQPKVFEVFQLLGFSQFFNIHDTIEEAVGYFKGSASAKAPVREVFPLIFACPICSKKLKAVKSGRFRCSECKTILGVDNSGTISLG